MAVVSSFANAAFPSNPSHRRPSLTTSEQQNGTICGPKEVEPQHNRVLFVGFNQDSDCFACGTDTGFRIYNCEPLKEMFRREFRSGGISFVEMLCRCNILAFVGAGANVRFPPNKVMIWDDHQGRCIGELSFRADVRAVKLRKDRIVVILEHKIFVYNFSDLRFLQQIETIPNSKGLCALSSTLDCCVLACPGIDRGQIRVEHYSLKKTKYIAAHDSELACLALSLDGRFLATASSKGTLIRIFNTVDGTRLQELRRGADRAEIYSISVSANAQWLAVLSDKGTVHVFGLKALTGLEEGRHATAEQDSTTIVSQPLSETNTVSSHGNSTTSCSPPNTGLNPGSTLSFMKGVLPKYFSSEWSFTQFRLPEESRYIVAFGAQKNTILIVSASGSFYRCTFDPAHRVEMVQQEYTKFI